MHVYILYISLKASSYCIHKEDDPVRISRVCIYIYIRIATEAAGEGGLNFFLPACTRRNLGWILAKGARTDCQL